MVFICFAVYVVVYGRQATHTRLKIWYNPCIIRQYIHGKTEKKHVLFSIMIIPYNVDQNPRFILEFFWS